MIRVWANQPLWVGFAIIVMCLSLCRGNAEEHAIPAAPLLVLKADDSKKYIDAFNAHDEELVKTEIPNATAWPFLTQNIPFFECPDKTIEEIYYFRWWTYRKHLTQTPDGWVVTEFLPKVPWSGKYNTICCPAGHHFYEGRWLLDPKFLNGYADFWFRKGGAPRSYSFWAADAMWARYCADGNAEFIKSLLPDLIANYREWEKSHLDESGLFWQIDDRDGMEVSIGGSGLRATINSYMYGDAQAISKIADLAGQKDAADEFRGKAGKLKQLTQDKLWDKNAEFFKVLPRGANSALALADVRELHGYTPWYFNLPDAQFSAAWKQLMDPDGFFAPFGLATAEQRHPKFALNYTGHECQWNGPSWPFATSVTLTALANLLNNYQQDVIGKKDYLALLKIYAMSQHRKLDDGATVPWIDENLNPRTGDWISRTRLKSWNNGTWDAGKGGVERGKDYNHSTYCDLVISGLVGLRTRADSTLEVNPLLPDGDWEYFCLDRVPYHGRTITILYDTSGQKYGKGKGLRIFIDGKEAASAEKLQRLIVELPAKAAPATAMATAAASTNAGWVKNDASPVLGGKLGTCFDITVLREEKTFRMWFSWRPKKSIALVESADGVHWDEPKIALGPNPNNDWEADLNRPGVVKRPDGYHMWYTGQAKGHSWIGHATSADGKAWTRANDKPVLSPDKPWEKVAVMCPDVMWDDDAKLYRMYYSGGEQYEPDAIGAATSPDGNVWTKHEGNPIFAADPKSPWEQHKVTACQVLRRGDWYYMFYIGFFDLHRAQIGIARSKDGVTNWQRHPGNPIISPTKGAWDHDACYKPAAVYIPEEKRWMLWYNGRKGSVEQIGVATHEGEDLGF